MESKKKIQRVRGNKLRLVIPLQKVTITPTGEEYEDYTVPEGAEVKVTMSNGFKRFEFTPEIVDNKLIIDDEGELTNGTYAIETTVSNTDDSPLRSKFCEVVEIVDCNDTLDGDYMDYVDFIEGSVTLDAQVFWFAAGEKGEKGDKGDKGEKGETEGRILVDNTPTYALYDAMYGNMYLMLNPVTRLQVILPPSEEEYMAQQFSIIFVADENCMIDFVGRSGVRSNIVNLPSVFIANKTYIVHCRAAVTDDASLSNVYVWFDAPLSEVAFSGAFTSLDNRPTTLAGYGITDAKIQNGVITLGGNTFSESDPTVPDWAKTQTKPTYTAEEVGAYTTDEVDDLIESIDVSDQIAGKQDTLVSGENIKTVNNQSLLGSGNVEIDIEGVVYSGSDVGQVAAPDFDPEADTVHVTAQTLSSAQQAQVRTNIGAQAALVSGTNIKTVNNESLLGNGNITIQGGGTQVQSDWGQSDSTAVDYIKNKPTIPDVTNFVQKNQTSGLLKNDGTVDTNSYVTASTAPVTSVNGQTGAVTIATGDANVIEGISINGTTQTVTSKNVDLPVPTSTAVTQIVSISQNAYNDLATKDSATLYLITS